MRGFIIMLFIGIANGSVEYGKNGEWFTVPTAQGPVRGRKAPTGDFYAFYGIHYATAPTGVDRFKSPLPPPLWQSPIGDVDEGIICPQAPIKFVPITLKQQEDCLIANIYVPHTDEEVLPVMVYVHGGAFQIGYTELSSYTTIARTEKVIVVTFNYRVGIHGFLCLGTEGAPGNAGMKDQVALLRWVNTNIANFGGNPKNVTIVGYSAGSSSVDLIMLSKSAEGLFDKVIPETGASLAAFAIQPDPVENAKTYAKKLNFTNVDDIYALEEFYQNLPFDVLASNGFGERTDSTFLFSPCVERKTSKDVFLDDSPLNILKSGNYKKVPVLYGFTNMDGLMRIDLFDSWKNAMNDNFSDFLPADLQFEGDNQRNHVAKIIKEFYFGDNAVSEETVLKYVDYFTDVFFAYPMLWAVKLYTEAGHDQIYLYEYSYVDDDTPVVPYTNVRGAAHCAQTMAVSDGLGSESSLLETTKKMKKLMRDIWANFVKTGAPIPPGSSLPAWPPVGANRSPHMSLGRALELRGPLLEERAHFWDQIYGKYYRQPVSPPEHPPRRQRKQ